MQESTDIEIHVIKYHNGSPQQVALYFKSLDQLITVDPDSARSLAFCLMECADFIQPPFLEDSEEDSIYGLDFDPNDKNED